MISWLKKNFTSTHGNDHRPHILRSHNIRYIIAVVICLEIIVFILPAMFQTRLVGNMKGAVLEAVLADLTNQEREERNLAILTVNQKLNEAAEMKANDMATKGYFAHISPEGKNPWYWLKTVGYEYQYAGENLAINFSDSKDVTNAWMNSPTHKENIVKGNYTEIGTGVAVGMYKGREAIFVSQVYANPIPKVTTKSLPIKTTPKKDTPSTATVKNTDVLGAETIASTNVATIPNPNLLERSVASPRHAANVFLYIIFAIFSAALLLHIFGAIRHRNFDLITNGLLVLALLGVIFITNYYLSYNGMTITQSIDY